jgi:hypothetical protein
MSSSAEPTEGIELVGEDLEIGPEACRLGHRTSAVYIGYLMWPTVPV